MERGHLADLLTGAISVHVFAQPSSFLGIFPINLVANLVAIADINLAHLVVVSGGDTVDEIARQVFLRDALRKLGVLGLAVVRTVVLVAPGRNFVKGLADRVDLVVIIFVVDLVICVLVLVNSTIGPLLVLN